MLNEKESMFDIKHYIHQVNEAADFIEASRSAVEPTPEVGIICGTGMGALAEKVERKTVLPYDQIPHFPLSTVESHQGNLMLGLLAGQPVMVMQGRFHFYEGYTMKEVTFPVRVMKALGVGSLVASNAAGGMHPQLRPGDLVAITDHINLMGDNPLIGPNEDSLGPRFPDMSEPYDRSLIALAREVALAERIRLREGVLAGVAGPNLETRAEYRFLRWAGADLVSMSLIPEAIVAVHGGLRLLAFAVVTDLCLPDALEAVDIPRILANAAKAEPVLTRLVTKVIGQLPTADARA